jgi:hypothetical protein
MVIVAPNSPLFYNNKMMNKETTMFTYTFDCSQKLTQKQIEFLNQTIQNLPSDSPFFDDIPEWTTIIDLLEKNS